MANESCAKLIHVLLKELGGRNNNKAVNLILDELVKAMDEKEDFITCDFCYESFSEFEGYYEKDGLIKCTYCPDEEKHDY
tara:strand:- start:629 stop:868 length:240 start_codon:yes stop_codon:yes gene_type:complete